MEGERLTVAADLGPAGYPATLIGADNETVALLLDSAAVRTQHVVN